MAEKKGSKKLQFLAFGLCSLLAMAVCLVVLVVTVRSVESSSSGMAQYDSQSKTQLVGEKAELISYLKALTDKTVNQPFVKCNTFTDIGVDDAAVTVCGAQGCESLTDKDLFIYAKNKIMPAVDGFYGEDFVGEFGTVYGEMPLVQPDEKLISDFGFSVGLADENGESVYDSNSGELIDADFYYVNFVLDTSAAGDADLAGLFELADDKVVGQRLLGEISSVCTAENINAQLTGLEIKAKINRLTDEIVYIGFVRTYAVSCNVSFIGETQVFGSKEISFEYRAEKRYEYSYASIRFAESSVTVEPGGEISLGVNAVIENDSEYTVSFESSDPQVATVDEMGYVKGVKTSDKPVIVTVRLEYLGESFTDTCLVYVAEETDG